MTIEEKKELTDKIINVLDECLGIKKICSSLNEEKELQEVINKQLIILKSLGGEDPYNNFIQKIQNIAPNFKVNNDYKPPINKDDLIDEINYINVFIKNTFNSSLEEMTKEQNNFLQNDSEAKATQKENINNQKRNSFPPIDQSMYGTGNPFTSVFNRNNRMNAMGFSELPPMYNPDFYPYKTKPVIIPILKNTIGLLFLFLALAQVLLLVATILCKDVIIGVDKDNKAITYGVNATIAGPIILIILMAYAAFHFLKTNNSDREKYFIRIGFSGALVIIYLIFGLITSFSVKDYSVLLNHSNWITKNHNLYKEINFLFAINIAYYCLVGVIVVVMFIAYFLNPVKDINRINRETNEWWERMNRDSGSGQSQNSSDNNDSSDDNN